MPRGKGHRKPPSQKKPPLTHFLCLPLVTAASKPQFEASIRSFRDDVSPDEAEQMENTSDLTRVHPKAIRPVGALHCTLGVMSLKQDELDKAIESLKSLDIAQLLANTTPLEAISSQSETSTQPSAKEKQQPASLERPISPPQTSTTTTSPSSDPLKIDLKGLASMHSPRNTSILYIDPFDPSQRLYNFCLTLQKLFKDNGFLLPDDRKLNLHATIVNTIYAKGKKRSTGNTDRSAARGDGESQAAGSSEATKPDEEDRSQGHGPNANAPLKMNARSLLEKYKDFVWAENVTLDRIAICEMGAKKKMDPQGNVVSEEYTEVASVALPM